MSVSGPDPRFRQLFLEEAAPALDRIGRDLLRLEQSPHDRDLIATLFRDIHNLKGGAGIVGLDEVCELAHAMEDALEPLRRGAATATVHLVDALLAAADGVRQLLDQLAGGAPDPVPVPALAGALRAAGAAAAAPAGPGGGSTAAGPDGGSTAAGPGAAHAPAGPRAQPADGRGRHAGAGPGPHRPAPAVAGRGAEPVEARRATLQVPVGRLDDIVRLVGEGTGAHARLGRYLEGQLSGDPAAVAEFRELAVLLNDLQERTTRARMVPVAALSDPLHRIVRDLGRQLGKQVRWEAEGTDTELDRSLVDHLTGPLVHLVRNAVGHGIETPAERLAAGKPEYGTVRLRAVRVGAEVVLTVADDGRGIDVPRVRAAAAALPTNDPASTDEDDLYLVFRTGLSTADEVTEVSGRGVGLDVVRTNLRAVRGRIEVRSEPGRFTEFTISVPVTLAVLRCLIVRSGGQSYALPLHAVLTALPPSPRDPVADGAPVVWYGDRTLPVHSLSRTLGTGPTVERGPAVVLAGLTRQRAFRVDELLGQRDVVVKALSPLLPRLPVCAGASAEPDGSVLLVLDADGLIDLARAGRDRPCRGAPESPGHGAAGPANGGPRAAGRHAAGPSGARHAPRPAAADPALPAAARRTILVVDDVLTVRELQRSILERAGYQVHVARDGVEALELAEPLDLDLVLTDVEMPRMDGLELTRRLRAHPRLRDVGVLLLTSLGTTEDRERGLAAGADGYLVKEGFDEAALLAAVERILGEHS
ncbi:MAG TPA: hybrid sensor histidine kinase/response regulator [Pilimelia sp.]|nr:hybrid sensor histidine kinase/response regulator [Pilimelia sp.]